MMAAGILLTVISAIFAVGLGRHSESGDYSERVSLILSFLAGVCGWLVLAGIALMFASVVTWLWRVMP